MIQNSLDGFPAGSPITFYFQSRGKKLRVAAQARKYVRGLKRDLSVESPKKRDGFDKVVATFLEIDTRLTEPETREMLGGFLEGRKQEWEEVYDGAIGCISRGKNPLRVLDKLANYTNTRDWESEHMRRCGGMPLGYISVENPFKHKTTV